MSSAQIPHFTLPFYIDASGTAAVNQQDTLDEIESCVTALLLTDIGDRQEVPDYGIPEVLFDVRIDTSVLTNVIDQWEPRASTFVTDAPDRYDDLIRIIEVRVASRATSV